MKQISLSMVKRTEKGRAALQALRGSGKIPGVIYGGGEAAAAISLDALHFDMTARRAGASQLFTVDCKGSDLDGELALIKEMQIEPLKSKVLHVDLYKVSKGQKIHVTVAVELIGDSPIVKAGEALLNQTAYDIDIECLPREIPDTLKVDISTLEIGQSIHAGDVELPEGATLRIDPSRNIVSVIQKRVEEVAPVVAEAVEGEAVEGATPADGDAAAAPAEGAAAEEKKD